MFLRCFLATESVKGTKPLFRGRRNSGSFGWAGMAFITTVNAEIGHNREEPRYGSGSVTVSLWFLTVLDHF